MKKRIVSILLVAAMSVSLFACGSKESSSSSDDSKKDSSASTSTHMQMVSKIRISHGQRITVVTHFLLSQRIRDGLMILESKLMSLTLTRQMLH